MDELGKLMGIAGGDDSLRSRHPKACLNCQKFEIAMNLSPKHRCWCNKSEWWVVNVTDKEDCILYE